MLYQAAGGLLIGWIAIPLALGLVPAAIVHLSRRLVDEIVRVAGEGVGNWSEFRNAVLLASIIGLLLILAETARGASSWLRTKMSDLVEERMALEVHQKSIHVDLAFYDLPEFHDHLHRARVDAYNRPMGLLDGIGSLLRNVVTLAGLMAVLISVSWLLPVLLLIGALPVLVVAVAHTYRYYRWQLDTTAERRRTRYLDWVLTGQAAAVELRVFDAGQYFSETFQEVRGRLRQRRLQLLKSEAIAVIVAVMLSLMAAGGALIWTVTQSVGGAITVGSLVMVLQSVAYTQRVLRNELRGLGEFCSNLLFLSSLFEFLDLEPVVVSPSRARSVPAGRPPAVEIRDVSFAYPGRDTNVLTELSLSLPAGRTTALVGRNGAGKSTLLKLLCRFYDPDSGTIEVNGIDIKELHLAEFRRLITVLFQESMQYSATVSENIALGSVGEETTREEVVGAARAAGADAIVADLPSGYDTLLGTWFPHGQALSVGQWQRLALARAFVRDAPIILLDEPTSSMDPWAEGDWMGRFQKHAAGRTALIITHRLTTAMRADVIHVLDGGQLVESGNHCELLEGKGLYAESWRRQEATGG